jgi:hypothetical protein
MAPDLREHLKYLDGLELLGRTGTWLEGVPPGKVTHFAGQAQVLNAAEMSKVGTPPTKPRGPSPTCPRFTQYRWLRASRDIGFHQVGHSSLRCLRRKESER